jgi:hypothetical protein
MSGGEWGIRTRPEIASIDEGSARLFNVVSETVSVHRQDIDKIPPA